MNDSRLDARRVGLGLRPPRVAVLIGGDCTWDHCVSLIGTLTQIWGGVAYALIPTDGQTISSVFWRLLKCYDPDWVAQYANSVSVSDRLWTELSKRLCLAQPTHDSPDLIWPDNIGWPYTQIHECLPDDRATERVRDLKVSGEPLAQALVYASAGCLRGGVRRSLEENGFEIVDEELVLDSADRKRHAFPIGVWVPRDRQGEALVPAELSLQYLGPYSTDDFRRHPVIAVCGDTLQDFALYWTLRALRGTFVSPSVFWIPKLYRKGQTDNSAIRALWPSLAQAAINQLQDVWGDKRVLATSLSVSDTSLDSLGSVLEEGALMRFPDQQVQTATVKPGDLGQLLPYETYYWELNNIPDVNMSVVQFLGGQGLAMLNTPTPKKLAVAHRYRTEMRWMVEVWIERLRLPVRPSQTRLVIEKQPFAFSRVSRLGAAYMANRVLTLSHQTVEAQLVRPRLRLPTDWQVFNALAGEAALSITLSDKGHYERELIRMLGDLPTVGSHLRHGGIVRTLSRFIDATPNEKGVYDEGVVIDKDKRRYLDLRAMAKLWNGDEDAARTLADKYLQNGVFQRGLVVKCPHCRKADWYPLKELSDKVACHRCSREHVFAADAAVYFRLDEIAAQVLIHNSHVSLLALDYLRRRSKMSFLYSTDCEVRREGEDQDKPWLEIDLLAVIDGELLVGECKIGKKLESPEKVQLAKYADFCAKLRPDRFLVATDALEWGKGSTQFLDKLQSRLVDMDVELVRLTGVDITWPPTVGETAISLDQVLRATAVDDLDEEEP